GDRVDVEVDGVRVDRQPVDARLLGGLPQRGRRQTRVARFAVPAELHPRTEAAVQAQQHPGGAGVDHQGAGGHVAGTVGPGHGRGAGPQQGERPVAGRAGDGVGRGPPGHHRRRVGVQLVRVGAGCHPRRLVRAHRGPGAGRPATGPAGWPTVTTAAPAPYVTDEARPSAASAARSRWTSAPSRTRVAGSDGSATVHRTVAPVGAGANVATSAVTVATARRTASGSTGPVSCRTSGGSAAARRRPSARASAVPSGNRSLSGSRTRLATTPGPSSSITTGNPRTTATGTRSVLPLTRSAAAASSSTTAVWVSCSWLPYGSAWPR